ncbi:MAG: redoxin domain-containing protein [Planctomycetota bacterium]|jgi:peroxiredoxin
MIKSYKNIEQAVRQLRQRTRPELDQRILQDAFSAMEESAGSRALVLRMRRWLTFGKFAAAAVIICVAVIGLAVYMKYERTPSQELAGIEKSSHFREDIVGADGILETSTFRPISDSEKALTQIIKMITSDDIEGLVSLLDRDDFSEQEKAMVARSLGVIGDERALGSLARLNLAALESGIYTDEINPYAQAISSIEARLGEAEDGGKILIAQTGDDLRIVPEEGFLILRVLDSSTQKPIEAAELDIEMQQDGPDVELKQATDANGLYKLKLPEQTPRHVTVNINKQSFVPVRLTFGDYKSKTELPASYVVSLEPGTSVGGIVKNELSEPIEGASVHLNLPGKNDKDEIEKVLIRDYTATTDSMGRWQCNTIPTGLSEVMVKLAHPDYVDDERFNASVTPSVESLYAGTAAFIMKRGAAVAGSVLDSSLNPIQGAVVSLGFSTWGSDSPEAKTVDDGSFIFSHCREGEIILTVQADGYSPDQKRIIADENTEPVEFLLEPGHTIRGRIVDVNNNPIPVVSVLTSSWRGQRSLNWKTVTDSEGYFEWNNAPPDEVNFNFSKGGYMIISNMPMSHLADEYLLTMYPQLNISGMVYDADTNEPVRDFSITTGMKWNRTSNIFWNSAQRKSGSGREGSYEYDFTYPADAHFIRIEAEGYLPGISREFGNEEGTVLYDFALEKGAGLNGTVYLEDGTTVSNAEVVICTASRHAYIHNGFNNSQWRKAPSVQTNEMGGFSLPAQTEDYLLVVLHDSGYAEVSSGQFSEDTKIVLQPWGRVVGEVYIGNTPGADEQVSLFYDWRYQEKDTFVRYLYKTSADANGFFVLNRVIPGNAKIGRDIQIESYRTVAANSEWLEIQSGQTAAVQLGGDGRAVTGAVVMPADYNDPVDWKMAGGNLNTKMPALPYPEYYSEMTPQQRSIWLDYWKKTELGQTYMETNSLNMKNSRSYGIIMQADGTFRIDDVVAGEYELNVSLHKGKQSGIFGGPRETIAFVVRDVVISEANEFDSEPLDLGNLELKPVEHLEIGDSAPVFETQTLDGKMINLQEYQGRIVLLVFWKVSDTWHTPDFSQMKGLYEKYGENEGLVIITISLDEADRTRKFVEENELQWLNCSPDSTTIARFYKDYNLETLPVTFVIGPERARFWLEIRVRSNSRLYLTIA